MALSFWRGTSVDGTVLTALRRASSFSHEVILAGWLMRSAHAFARLPDREKFRSVQACWLALETALCFSLISRREPASEGRGVSGMATPQRGPAITG